MYKYFEKVIHVSFLLLTSHVPLQIGKYILLGVHAWASEGFFPGEGQ